MRGLRAFTAPTPAQSDEENAIAEQVGPLAQNEKVYRTESLYPGRTGERLAKLREDRILPIIKSMVTNVHAAIRYVRNAAEQLPKIDRWATMLSYICQRIVGQPTLPTPPPALAG